MIDIAAGILLAYVVIVFAGVFAGAVCLLAKFARVCLTPNADHQKAKMYRKIEAARARASRAQ